ncbi:uncharacterized protein AC631_02256 [Debaryomyces fabryi]|uniref:Uncharacterized protein n=1 Tax=Debaryomyces fabryi TaxID=58627 RepID=A0A0V1Q0C2_9ASCO|nr:uncharacterized protein AC631_02256 [Debaryomyces fabryi]KSA01965.1 hypothetical protein AC631_02256 [Debaryomyces fabryi]CUM54547.1 unnamed protein product [Debaryomyces fabryi]
MNSSQIGMNLSNFSDSYYRFADTSSFKVPSSPINSTSHKRKRSEDLDIITHITIHSQALGGQIINEHAKRCQSHKIHSEVHQNTIDLMMKSQKILQEQERLHKLYHDDNSMHENTNTNDMIDSFKQRPFWPVLNKNQT